MISSEFELHRLLQAATPRTAMPASTDDVLVVDSRTLFAGHAEVRIEHQGAVYRLKQTSLGKLILTK